MADASNEISSIAGVVIAGGPMVISFTAGVFSLVVLWRWCGKPMIDGLQAFAAANAAAAADLKAVSSSLAGISTDMTKEIARVHAIANKLQEVFGNNLESERQHR